VGVLEGFGEVARTGFFNVLAVRVADPAAFAPDFAAFLETFPAGAGYLARVVPATSGFAFADPEEFRDRAAEAALAFLEVLAGRSFHVRLHRRGFKGVLQSVTEEQVLDARLMERLAAGSRPGRITFDDPDVILAVETLGNRAGLSAWTRADLARYPFLGLD
jgi:tRNA(Ser,Leu) C12 N-acetylase TAN1